MHKLMPWIAVGVLLIPWIACGQTYPEAVFILDSSGSMSEAAGAQAKIDAAKSVLDKAVPALPPEVKIGLVAYGHRKDKDCSDVEILVRAGSADRADLMSKAHSLQPRGLTPISLAVQQVAENLKGRLGETTIVLISDGKETCAGDPCATVRALKASGANFIMHVVGFGVTAEDKEQLSCIAEAGGGQYFTAGDADGLLAALETVNQEIAQKVEKAKTQVVTAKTGLGKLRLQMPESALKSLAGIRVARKSDGKTVKEGEIKTADSIHPLMSGEYSLTLRFANPNYQPPTEVPLTEFTIAAGETSPVVLGDLVFNVADELIDLSVSAVIISESGTGRQVLESKPMGNDYYLFKPKALPAGTYDVAILYYRSPRPTVVGKGIEVKDGEEAYLTLDSGLFLQKPETSDIEGWDLYVNETTNVVLSVRRGRDNDEPLWRKFIVPPGVYDLELQVRGMSEPLAAGDNLEIKKGETLSFNTGL